MSMKSVCIEDPYLSEKYWSNRCFDEYRTSPLYGRSWRYWNHPSYGYRYIHNDSDTLRFNRHVHPSVYYPEAEDLESSPVLAPGTERVEQIKIQRMPLQRSNSFVSLIETKSEVCDDDGKYDCNYDYNYIEELGDCKSIRKSHKSLISNMSKSMSNMSKSCTFADEPTIIEPKRLPKKVTLVCDKNKYETKKACIKTQSDAGTCTDDLVNERAFPDSIKENFAPFFNGSSYGILSERLTIKDAFNASFQFKTSAQNGVLMSIIDRATTDSFFIELQDSQLKATLYVDGTPESCWTNFHNSYFCNNDWSEVQVRIINNKITLSVGNKHFHKTHRFPFRRPIRGDLLVAGYSSPYSYRQRNFFVGEMRNFYINNDGIKWYGNPNVNPGYKTWYF